MATDEILDLMVLDIFPDASSREPAPKRPKVMSSLTASTLTASAPGELSSLSAAAPSPATSTVTLEDPILNQMTPVVSSKKSASSASGTLSTDAAILAELPYVSEGIRRRILETTPDSQMRQTNMQRVRIANRVARCVLQEVDPIFLEPRANPFKDETSNISGFVSELFLIGSSKIARACTSLLRWTRWVEDNAHRFTLGRKIADKPSRAVLFEFFSDLQLSQSADSKGTGPTNVRKGLRNAVQYLNLSILLEDLDSAVIKAVAGRPESKGQSATVDKATMSAFHQVNMELIGAGLTPSVATEGESAGFTWGTSPSWKIAPEAHWPEGGLSTQGLFTAQALAVKSIWNQRSIEFLGTRVLEVVDRDGDKPPYCRIRCDGAKGKHGTHNNEPYESFVPLIGILEASEEWMVPFAKQCVGLPFVLRAFKAECHFSGDPRRANKWVSGEGAFRCMTDAHLNKSWYAIMSCASGLSAEEMKRLHLTPYATRMLGVTVGRFLRYPLEAINELGRWKPLEVSLSSGATKAKRPVNSMANGYSRSAGEAVELSYRIKWIMDARRVLGPFLSGTQDLPSDLFDMTIFAEAGIASESAPDKDNKTADVSADLASLTLVEDDGDDEEADEDD